MAGEERVGRDRWGASDGVAERPRAPGWVVGHVAGTPVLLAPSWLVTAAFLTWLFLPTVRAVAPGLGLLPALAAATALPLLLAASVLVHEIGHGVTARLLGIPATEYVVTLLGGHTQFDREMRSPGASALVSAVGPLGNAALAALCWWGAQQTAGLIGHLLWAGAVTNGFVAVFNLLPGLPLDGGRVLEAAVWRATGERWRGTRAAGWVGRLLAVGVVVWWLGGPMLEGGRPSIVTAVIAVLVGGVLWFGASQAVRAAAEAHRAGAVDLLALARPAATASVDAVLAEIDGALAAGDAVVLLDQAGRPVALADPAAAAAVPNGLRSSTPVRAVAVPVAARSVVSEWHGVPAVRAVSSAQHAGPAAVLVDSQVEPPRVVGVVEVARVAEAMATAPRQEPGEARP
jgi:Zn-dependent protease